MEIVVATKNKGKLREFARILHPLGVEVLGMEDIGLHPDIVEDGTTFAENAAIKARTLHQLTGKAAISDDSGLCVDAMDGRPGVYSARYGGEDLGYPEKIAMLQEELREVPREKRTASYECVICFVDEQGEEHLFHGSVNGWIGYECRGERGFGYDPVFYVGDTSFASLTDEEKDRLSHRGEALRKFAAALPGLLNR